MRRCFCRRSTAAVQLLKSTAYVGRLMASIPCSPGQLYLCLDHRLLGLSPMSFTAPIRIYFRSASDQFSTATSVTFVHPWRPPTLAIRITSLGCQRYEEIGLHQKSMQTCQVLNCLNREDSSYFMVCIPFLCDLHSKSSHLNCIRK